MPKPEGNPHKKSKADVESNSLPTPGAVITVLEGPPGERGDQVWVTESVEEVNARIVAASYPENPAIVVALTRWVGGQGISWQTPAANITDVSTDGDANLA